MDMASAIALTSLSWEKQIYATRNWPDISKQAQGPHSPVNRNGADVQGLRHADENGGTETRRQWSQNFLQGNPYQKPKTQRIWPTIFLKMGGLSPTLKNGGRIPRSPCYGAPGNVHIKLCAQIWIFA